MYREVLTNMSIQVSPNLYIELWPIPLLILAGLMFAIASFVKTEKPYIEQKIDRIEKEQHELKLFANNYLPKILSEVQKIRK